MNAQEIMEMSRLTRVRELQTQLQRASAENQRLADENAMLKAHLDLAILAARDLETLPEGGKLVIVDGWNQILGADRVARSPEELLAQARTHLAENPADLVWIVFDGPHENARLEGRLRVSYTGGHGEHRADRFICDFLRMARFRGDLSRIAVKTDDKDFKCEIMRICDHRH